MRGYGFLFPVEGAPSTHEWDRPLELDEVNKLIGGYIELVPLWKTTLQGQRCVVFCDEEGKNKNLPFNAQATAQWRMAGERNGVQITDVLVGPVLILTGDDEFMATL